MSFYDLDDPRNPTDEFVDDEVTDEELTDSDMMAIAFLDDDDFQDLAERYCSNRFLFANGMFDA